MEPTLDCYKELQPGYTLNGGKYVIEKKIGEGGFGITYRAVQTGLNRAVCIKEYFLAGRCIRNTQAKTIQLQGADEAMFEKYRAAFVKEAQTLAALHHPGIVEVIDIFDENNTSYMVMPFVEGRSLQSIVEKNGPLTYPEAVNYIGQVANAVGYIHDRHILHRDIKPDNIMITADYKAVLIDFGSAREFEEDKTQAQTSMVTHGYAPTEQYTRNSRKGAYTDIYAIGATLYFILTGKVPYEAAARITEAMPEPKELNPDLPEEANRTIMKAMQLKSQDRHQSIAEFMDDLRNVKPSAAVPKDDTQASVPITPKENNETKPTGNTFAKTIPQVESVPRKKSKKPLIITSVAVAMAALGAVLFLVMGGESQKHKEAAAHVDEYNQAVKCCKRVVEVWSENTDSLLMARDIMENTVRRLETEYAQEMPEVYNQLQGLADAIFPKLKAVAKEYADDARGRIIAGDDPGTIMQELELSLRIFDDPNVRRELDDYKELHGVSSSSQTQQSKPANTNEKPTTQAKLQGKDAPKKEIRELTTWDDNIVQLEKNDTRYFENKFSKGKHAYDDGEYEAAIRIFEDLLAAEIKKSTPSDDKYKELEMWLEKSKVALRSQIREEERSRREIIPL